MKKLIGLCVLVFLFGACEGYRVDYTNDDYCHEPKSVLVPTFTQEPVPEPTPKVIPESASESTVPFASIIYFYKTLEQDNFINLDMESDAIVGQLHPIVWRYNMGIAPESWRVMYALYDISGNGQMDLIIGATTGQWVGPCIAYIVGIYTLSDGIPLPVIRYTGGSGRISLYTDVKGNVNIVSGSGRGGEALEFFYTIDKNGKLIELFWIQTHNFDLMRWEEYGLNARDRFKSINGDSFAITEDDYVDLMVFFGSGGYEPIRRINPRPVNLEWKYITCL